ncbi:GNAT family N-acetyltransferase [Streptacidiphilus jiangxiensis]|uniref:Acetyltransferase (GNAT) family protein n=1 Tax=Streptacidiphilus jiangxiensis TaxID=235985 RepID=A0A1H7U3B2_STRJI|nr:GNAT family N-acetyltransferase [Streptacidiphilus jiangxiensis]SEL91156.1 Acetyltransferase (GNAT) family protein [Streptacidiphilus jiangxiensis]
MASSSLTHAPIVADWVSGWVVSRGAAEPVTRPWGWTVDVGQPTQVARHVVVDADEARVREAAAQAQGEGWWLKVFLPEPCEAPEAQVCAWLGPGWASDEAAFLMSVELEDVASGVLPPGYGLRTWTRGDVVRVLVAAPDGALAARGQMGLAGEVAVADQILTAPAHQRRGLGSVVMRTLQQQALAAGATRAVLGATTQGRALYESLGWRAHTAFASLYRTAPLHRTGAPVA